MNNKKKIIIISLFVLKELKLSLSDSEEDLDALSNIKIAYRRKIPRLKNYVKEVIPK